MSRKQINMEDIADIHSLINPQNIVHEGAKHGSEILLNLDDEELYNLFDMLCMKHERDIEKVIEKCIPDDVRNAVSKNDLQAALRRLSIVGESLAAKIKESRVKEKAPAKAQAVKLNVNPGSLLSQHIETAKNADKNMDCVQKMAGLASLLGDQLESLYAYPTREAQPYMGVKHVNMVAQTYMNALSSLHRMQIDVGIVEKAPEKMEVNMRHAGAFQTYIGELSQEHKDSMIEFADSFCRFVDKKVNKVADAS